MLNFLKSIFSGAPKVDYRQLVKDGAIIIDVRTPDEFASGHISGSQNIPLHQLQSSISKLQAKKKAVITVCRSGARSGMANKLLQKHGLASFNGGAWTSLNRQLARHDRQNTP